MKIYQFGSSLINEEKANDYDLIIVSDKPVDICLYSEEEWEQFKKVGFSISGHRIVAYPNQGVKTFPKDRKKLGVKNES